MKTTKEKGQDKSSVSLNDQSTITNDTTSEKEFIDRSPEVLEMQQFKERIGNSPEVLQMQEYQQQINVTSSDDNSSQQEQATDSYPLPHKKKNTTGIPDNIKHGIENLSGILLDDVKVYYNSDKPKLLGVPAYTEGTNIYIGPGNEEYLPHEVWHVIQQKQRAIKANEMLKGKKINRTKKLEDDAEKMGKKGLSSTHLDHTKKID